VSILRPAKPAWLAAQRVAYQHSEVFRSGNAVSGRTGRSQLNAWPPGQELTRLRTTMNYSKGGAKLGAMSANANIIATTTYHCGETLWKCYRLTPEANLANLNEAGGSEANVCHG